jgi:Bacterial regulatory proteins, gntR family/Binding-protein-dependent transport system inner membrane component
MVPMAMGDARRSGPNSADKRPIDPSHPLAVYVQLKSMLLEAILSGSYGADGQMPTEHELCALHGIGRTPVHRALAELADEGVILRHRRRGSYVNPHWLRTNADSGEVRVLVPDGPSEQLLRRAADGGPRRRRLRPHAVPLQAVQLLLADHDDDLARADHPRAIAAVVPQPWFDGKLEEVSRSRPRAHGVRRRRAVLMMGSFFADIPTEIIDAAQVDGAQPLTLFRRIALPLAVPGIVSFAIVGLIFVWNDMLLALTLLGRDRQPLTVGLANLSSPHLAQENLVAAASIMAILPPMLLFACLNRYYVRGLFAGATKG